jgi:hypothetical protein
MSSKFWVALTVFAGLLMVGVPAVAHHSIASEYDFDKPVELKGALIRMDWINPHSIVHLEVTNQDGSKTEWLFQSYGTNNPLRRPPKQGGFEVGQTYTLSGFAAKNGKTQAFLKSVTMQNGRVVTLWFGDPNG